MLLLVLPPKLEILSKCTGKRRRVSIGSMMSVSTICPSYQWSFLLIYLHLGPVQGYMAKCDSDCKDFTPSASTKWFKVSALGLVSGSNDWYQAKMNDGSPLPVTIPSALPSGNYLLRHEIIALQNAKSPHLAEFYPNCIQMKITGGPSANTDLASVGPTANFPGTYKFSDPGIEVDVYTPPLNYVMPGPAVANIAKGSGGDSDSSSNDTSSSAAAPSATKAPANAAPAPTEAPSSSSMSASAPTSSSTSKGQGQCKRSNKSKRSQKRALKAHAKRRTMDASY